MVTHMRRFLAMITLLVAATALPATPALADHPSPGAVRTAVNKAEKSSSLWATVNICNSRRDRNDLGIRGQMPSLGFAAWMSMDIKLYYYSNQKRYLPVPTRGSKLVRLGRSSSGLHQSGAMFQFSPHQPRLKAVVTFIWRRSGQLLGKTTRTTTARHRNADFASPPHYSAATCTIK
ncbi:MAG: hypothetical protein QOF83_4284 [Solirubrobacteraceae bacterium]|jgi:hypothetical protein|nr:hypothetical protein [Solirubrobacteraceae bacterium]